MKKNAVVIAGVIVLVAAVAWIRSDRRSADETPAPASAPAPDTHRAPAPNTATGPLPRLVDLGAGVCIACKKMAPILEELRKEYAGRARIEFIDVWKNPDAGRQYGIRIIPVQIFFDRHGKEVWRHEGFLSRAEIVAKFTEMGVE
jgi:thioredoxin 1